MKNIGIFYGSTLGFTKKIAGMIFSQFGEENADLHNIENCKKEDIERYENLVFGTSTWGLGEMQEDWRNFAALLEKIDFTGKKVALFSVGDQKERSDSFVNGMGILYHKIKPFSSITGFTEIDNYDFDISLAVRENQFVGLAIDEKNQPELTKKRITDWVNALKEVFVK